MIRVYPQKRDRNIDCIISERRSIFDWCFV